MKYTSNVRCYIQITVQRGPNVLDWLWCSDETISNLDNMWFRDVFALVVLTNNPTEGWERPEAVTWFDIKVKVGVYSLHPRHWHALLTSQFPSLVLEHIPTPSHLPGENAAHIFQAAIASHKFSMTFTFHQVPVYTARYREAHMEWETCPRFLHMTRPGIEPRFMDQDSNLLATCLHTCLYITCILVGICPVMLSHFPAFSREIECIEIIHQAHFIVHCGCTVYCGYVPIILCLWSISPHKVLGLTQNFYQSFLKSCVVGSLISIS